LDEKTMSAVLAAVAERRLYKEGVLPLLRSFLETGNPVEDRIRSAEAGAEIPPELGPIVMSVMEAKLATDAARVRRAMGLLMETWRGRVDGARAAAEVAGRVRGGAR